MAQANDIPKEVTASQNPIKSNEVFEIYDAR
jgi:hypothetical protein